MDVNRIRELLPHRYPFQLVDKVIEIGANYIVGVKNITANVNSASQTTFSPTNA